MLEAIDPKKLDEVSKTIKQFFEILNKYPKVETSKSDQIDQLLIDCLKGEDSLMQFSAFESGLDFHSSYEEVNGRKKFRFSTKQQAIISNHFAEIGDLNEVNLFILLEKLPISLKKCFFERIVAGWINYLIINLNQEGITFKNSSLGPDFTSYQIFNFEKKILTPFIDPKFKTTNFFGDFKDAVNFIREKNVSGFKYLL